MIQRDHGTFTEVTVPWKLSPATDEDLRPSSGTMVFVPGQGSYVLTLQTVDDNVSLDVFVLWVLLASFSVYRFVCVCVCVRVRVRVCVCVRVLVLSLIHI